MLRVTIWVFLNVKKEKNSALSLDYYLEVQKIVGSIDQFWEERELVGICSNYNCVLNKISPICNLNQIMSIQHSNVKVNTLYLTYAMC